MTAATGERSGFFGYLPNWPLELWMIAATLLLGLFSGASAAEFVTAFNTGWGRALGEFALILVPSFALAAALSHQESAASGRLAKAMGPVTGAGMVCPDTAYASLAPIAGPRKLSVAFGSYAGFKLLIPAGPLIVATGLGVAEDSIFIIGIVLLIPVWAVGEWWVSCHRPGKPPNRAMSSDPAATAQIDRTVLRILAPFIILMGLLVLGTVTDFSGHPVLDYLTLPKGALLCAAVWAILHVPTSRRRDCLNSAISRTGSLLLIIGAASAFGAMLTTTFPVTGFVNAEAGAVGIISLFALSAMFKLMQGSSMATFAAVAPVAAPIVAASQMSHVGAVFAICLGSFIAILPNDSFYWLVRKDSLEKMSDGKSIILLSGGALLQALTGLAVLLLMTSFELI